MAKLSESDTVTETSSGLVLPAKEKNPSVDGTIANSIQKIKNRQEYYLLSDVVIMQNGYELWDDQWYNTIVASGSLVSVYLLLLREKGNGTNVLKFKDGFIPKYPIIFEALDAANGSFREFRLSPNDGLINMLGNAIPGGNGWLPLNFQYVRQ